MNPLPDFPDMRPVEITDRELFDTGFKKTGADISELNFTNLFMFRKVHDYKVSTLNGNIVILARSYKDTLYFFPPVGGAQIKDTLGEMFGYMKQNGMSPVIEAAWEGFIEEHIKGDPAYVYLSDPDSADYIYDTKMLIDLPGRKYHKKKNLKNKFEKQYEGRYEYRRLDEGLVEGAIDLVYRWCQEKCTVESLSTFGETEATMFALKDLDGLGTIGGVALMDGKVEALALGELLNEKTVVVHVEKANASFPGLYQYISSEFLQREFPDVPLTNREQDLGEPGLRKSKLSYHPVGMVEKYRIRPAG